MELIAAYFIITSGKYKLGLGNLLSTVALQLRNPYLAELCGTLVVLQFLKWCLYKYKLDFSILTISLVYDCAAVLDFFLYLPFTIPMTSLLYQIKREIIYILRQLGIVIKPIKVKVY